MIPPTMPIATVSTGRGAMSATTAVRGLAAAAVEHVAEHHRAGADQQRRAERDLDVVLGALRVAHQAQQVGAEERHRHRAEHHPAAPAAG